MVRYLHEGCDDLPLWERVWEMHQQHRLTLILCERVTNLPAQLLPPLYSSVLEALVADVGGGGEGKGKKKGQKGGGEKPGMGDRSFLVLSYVYKRLGGGQERARGVKKERRKGERGRGEEGGEEGEGGEEPALMFPHPEDELLMKVGGRRGGGGGQQGGGRGGCVFIGMGFSRIASLQGH